MVSMTSAQLGIWRGQMMSCGAASNPGLARGIAATGADHHGIGKAAGKLHIISTKATATHSMRPSQHQYMMTRRSTARSVGCSIAPAHEAAATHADRLIAPRLSHSLAPPPPPPPAAPAVQKFTAGADQASSVITHVNHLATVYPASPTQTNCWVPLSHLDILMPDHDILACFAYAPPLHQPSSSFHSIVSSLKSSLAKALVAYYPLAGRLVLMKDDEDGAAGPSLDCSVSGVEFEEASTDAQFQDVDCLQPKSFDEFAPRKRIPSQLRQHEPKQQEELPFSVKVTRFRCGGIVLGCRFHHKVVDACAAAQFLITWSKISRGMDMIQRHLPIHQRNLFIKPRNPPQPSEAEQHHAETPMPSPSEHDPKMQVRSYYMSKEMIGKLKRETQNDAYSSVTAFFWRASVRAREVEREKTAHINVIMNCRSILGVPSRLFGNVLACGVAEMEVSSLLCEPLGAAAQRVTEALGRLDRGSIQSVVDMTETRRRRLLEAKAILVPSLGREEQDSMLSSSLSGFPWYKMDFGWGSPCFASVNPSRRYHGFLYFVPAPPTWDGGLISNIESVSANGLDLDHELQSLTSLRPQVTSLASLVT